MKENNKSIILIGMPGCGKTTIGSIISKKLEKDFIDIDEYIEKVNNATIKEMFKKGEEYFREAESRAVREIAKIPNNVVATGGGVIKRGYNIDNLKEQGKVYFIDRDVENIIEDIDVETRPLLAKDKNVVRKLYEERYDLYNKYCDEDSCKCKSNIVCYS